MRDVFRWHMDVPSKNARWGCGPGARSAEGALRGVLSFGYFSLHKQRKVTRVAEAFAPAFAPAVAQGLVEKTTRSEGKGKSFRAWARVTFLCSRKEK
ncbi:hypothetical protein ISN35_17310 [Xanthomonas translucens pv. undulosa]|uniref:hypothetical protein n=1 Tax=Xanthomonas campestris pv. translucens TaxID=343 RepID=UPI0012D880DE|nr:hypothetical protein [Xanthomonas translucens]QSQ40058.1 hypothetical protein ISN33_10125 [Xanthomonas translucens pv. translucens]QSQ48743.1 hypothetical protein ISN35_17310 [Xanthomonas translucens pv. undulosa]QSQ51144.1 hypothetical protein ISN36_09840 [Xanthomonas translucens pv. undulosa]QSQ59940.1 hypothetical protein ISN38_17915 [Xanthomonas translucens pv. undulosa]WKZ99661.1 hypothetical protein MO330_12245 [Xanthomonas translucens]